MLKGSLDAIHNGQCYGWALDDCSSVPVEVSIFVDERFAGAGKAENYCLDLEQAGLADGKLGYCIDLPDALRDGRYHRVEARDAAGRVIASRDSIQVVPRLTPAEFDRHAPWIDAPNETFEIELKKRKVAGVVDPTSEARLRHFREHGFLILEQAVPHPLIDKALDDVESAWSDLPPVSVLNSSLGLPVLMREMTLVPDFRSTSVRYLDFHNTSDAAAEIMMLPQILRFAELCFGEQVAAMQTPLFENGTQQRSHQDFAYVHSLRPPCLMGAWVALEDARPDAGPLFYWDRSHRAVPKYVFADGSVLAEGNGQHVRDFEAYLERACQELGLERLIFTPKKGDMLVWHSALVHGGMPRKDLSLTRKSIVSHYTTQSAYPYDRRRPNDPPIRCERNGGVYYGLARPEHVEARYRLAIA